MKRRVVAALLAFVSAHLLLLHLNFAFRYSATVGAEQATRESKVAGNLAFLFLALPTGLQFLIAWLLRPSELRVPTTNGSSLSMQLAESRRLGPWEQYTGRLSTSVAGTLGLLGFLLFIASRTSYLSAVLKFLGVA